jgi:Na+/proline symporter
VSTSAWAILAGVAITLLAALGSEVCWLLPRPATVGQGLRSWVVAIAVRAVICVAGLVIGIKGLGYPVLPLTLTILIGYAIALVIETRLTLRRIRRLAENTRA